MSQEKTEKPTRRRLHEVRKRGQSPRSVEAAQAAALLATVFVLPTGVHHLRTSIVDNFYAAIEVASYGVVASFERNTVFGWTSGEITIERPR